MKKLRNQAVCVDARQAIKVRLAIQWGVPPSEISNHRVLTAWRDRRLTFMYNGEEILRLQ